VDEADMVNDKDNRALELSYEEVIKQGLDPNLKAHNI
jgi:hypothetical protein